MEDGKMRLVPAPVGSLLGLSALAAN